MSTLDTIRSQIFGRDHKPRSVLITFFGAEIELRQDSMGNMLDAQNAADADRQDQLLRVIIRRAYIPGTDTRVFTEADIDGLRALPWNSDWTNLANKVAELDSANFPSESSSSSETTGNTPVSG